MAVKNFRNLAASAANSDLGAGVVEDALSQLEDAPVAPPGNGQQAISNGRSTRPQRFADTTVQKAYYTALDDGLQKLVAQLSEEFGQVEPTIYEDLNDRIIERLFTIKCKIVKAVSAGKADTGEQMSEGFKQAFVSVMSRACAKLFPDTDPDILIRTRGLPSVNGSRFSRMMLTALANRVAEEYSGSEVVSEGYDLLQQAQEARTRNGNS